MENNIVNSEIDNKINVIEVNELPINEIVHSLEECPNMNECKYHPPEAMKIKKTQDMYKYRQEYYKKNRDKWFEHYTCEICEGKYSTCNKSKHMNSKKHQFKVLENKLKVIGTIL